MNFEQITISVVEELQKLNIPYMLTGALAVNYHGKPRMTHDIDIVALITIGDIQKIRELFEKNFFKIYWFRPAGKNEYKYPSNS